MTPFSLGYIERPGLNIVGVRHNVSRVNYYDDDLWIWEEDEPAYLFSITTIPGIPYLKNPINPRGAALLKAGTYEGAYALGLHRGKYLALVQVGPVTVFRDNNRDLIVDKSCEETGLFGINIHRSGGLVSNFVDANSAGCQVFKYAEEFNKFIEVCVDYRKRTVKNSFTYTLLEEP